MCVCVCVCVCLVRMSWLACVRVCVLQLVSHTHTSVFANFLFPNFRMFLFSDASRVYRDNIILLPIFLSLLLVFWKESFTKTSVGLHTYLNIGYRLLQEPRPDHGTRDQFKLSLFLNNFFTDFYLLKDKLRSDEVMYQLKRDRVVGACKW